MKKTLKVIIPCLFILSILFPFHVSAQDTESFKPGVSPGDSFTYKFYVSWKAPEPLETPINISELNNTKMVRIVVHEALYAIVVMNVTTYFKNDTQRQSQIYVNLLNGEGDGFGFMIAPNLSPNRTAYHMGMEKGKAFLLKRETLRQYPFGERKVLLASVETYHTGEYIKILHNMCFDKETGVMLEWSTSQTPKYSPTVNVTLFWQIEEFNVKQSGNTSDGQTDQKSYHGILIPVIAGVLLFAAVALYRWKKRKR